jgi:predicted HTH domain antitoxin
MQSIGIKDLQLNPAILTRSLEADEYTMITKRNKPIGIAFSFDDMIITDGLKTALMVDAYKKGLLSLGQTAQALQIEQKKLLKLLSTMGIEVIDYDFADDLKFLDSF